MYQIIINGETYTGNKPRAIAHGGTVYPANCKDPAWVEVPEPVPTPPTLAEVKANAIAANRAECRQRIEAVWPDWAQSNAALGVYSPDLAAACRDWIASNVVAENAAADKIDLAADADAVAAVKVEWPANA